MHFHHITTLTHWTGGCFAIYLQQNFTILISVYACMCICVAFFSLHNVIFHLICYCYCCCRCCSIGWISKSSIYLSIHDWKPPNRCAMCTFFFLWSIQIHKHQFSIVGLIRLHLVSLMYFVKILQFTFFTSVQILRSA